jgi:hypothetical protein
MALAVLLPFIRSDDGVESLTAGRCFQSASGGAGLTYWECDRLRRAARGCWQQQHTACDARHQWEAQVYSPILGLSRW